MKRLIVAFNLLCLTVPFHGYCDDLLSLKTQSKSCELIQIHSQLSEERLAQGDCPCPPPEFKLERLVIDKLNATIYYQGCGSIYSLNWKNKRSLNLAKLPSGVLSENISEIEMIENQIILIETLPLTSKDLNLINRTGALNNKKVKYTPENLKSFPGIETLYVIHSFDLVKNSWSELNREVSKSEACDSPGSEMLKQAISGKYLPKDFSVLTASDNLDFENCKESTHKICETINKLISKKKFVFDNSYPVVFSKLKIGSGFLVFNMDEGEPGYGFMKPVYFCDSEACSNPFVIGGPEKNNPSFSVNYIQGRLYVDLNLMNQNQVLVYEVSGNSLKAIGKIKSNFLVWIDP